MYQDDTSMTFSDRTCYHLVTRDHQVFDLYEDAAKDGLWILSYLQDSLDAAYALCADSGEQGPQGNFDRL
jgi:hypothetical protein